MLDLATSGAGVLHTRSVEMAKKYNVELVVRSSLNRSEGTVVKEGANIEKLLVTGVAADKDTVRISVIGLEDKPGTAFAVFNTLAANNINVDIILQSVGREGTKDISFTVASDDLEHAIEVLNANKERLTIQDITWNEKVAKLSIVGAGMMSNPGVAAKMFESLYNSRVNINMISTSEIRITVLVPEEDIEKAIRGNLRISLKLGLLDDAADNPYAAIGVTDTVAHWSKPETKELVREATRKSVVLLKNKSHLLPLDKQKIKKIAVIGQRATEVLQDWYSGKPFYTVNVLDAIREEAGDDIEVRYVATNRMDSARTVAAWADVAIVCVGNHPTCDAGWEQAPVISEGKEAVDRQSIQLDQEDLLLQVAQANPNTIGVLISSFPYAINRANQRVPALLHLTQ